MLCYTTSSKHLWNQIHLNVANDKLSMVEIISIDEYNCSDVVKLDDCDLSSHRYPSTLVLYIIIFIIYSI